MSTEIYSVVPVLDELKLQVSSRIKELGRAPRLAILRAVSDPAAVLLEKRILSACRDTGIEPWSMELPAYLPQDILSSAVHKVGQDPSIDGVALICPEQYDLRLLGAAIGESKDVGGLLRSASARFMPCYDSAILRVLQHYAFPLNGKSGVIAGYSESKHFILKSVLSLQGATVIELPEIDSSFVSDRPDPDIIFTSVDPVLLKKHGLLSKQPFVFAIGTGFYGQSLFSSDWIDALSNDCGGLFPLPEGLDVLIPYIYIYNTAFSAQKR